MLKKPNTQKTPSGWKFEYEKEKILITLSRIHQHKDGRIISEVLIETTSPGTPSHLHQAQLNLLSTKSRQSLSKLMNERYELNWDEILEQVSAIALQMIRQGEPVIFISTTEEIKPLEYLITPILPLGLPTTLFGVPGTAKSYIALLYSILALLPWTDNPLGFETQIKPCLPLYLDYESDEREFAYRLKKIQRGMELPDLILPYRRCSLPFADDIDQIQEIAYEDNINFLIVDSLGAACGGDIYNPEPALRFFTSLRKLRITSLLVAHTSKELSKEKSILGTVFFTAYSRQIFEARIAQEVGEDEISVGLFHRKSNTSKLSPPVGLKFEFNDKGEKVIIERQDVRGIAAFLEQLPLAQRIRELLKEEAMGLSEIAEMVNTSKEVVAMTLSRMKGKGLIVKLGEKKWGLKSIEEEETSLPEAFT